VRWVRELLAALWEIADRMQDIVDRLDQLIAVLKRPREVRRVLWHVGKPTEE